MGKSHGFSSPDNDVRLELITETTMNTSAMNCEISRFTSSRNNEFSLKNMIVVYYMGSSFMYGNKLKTQRGINP